ncbi:MAG TPA: hypothetical protein VMH89_09875 [Candidatus Acidoferrum sp.]|nr:hypothetical protein [Candidatus Acidoferrum sp.]
MKFLTTILGALLLFGILPAKAQSPDTNSNSQTSAKPADPSDKPAEKKKPKKVWTDDDISSVKGGVSVVGDAKASSEKQSDNSTATPAGDEVRQKQIQNYRDQIQQYQSQMDAIDKRISQLRNFKAENTAPSGGINPNQGYNMVPVEDQVKQLEEKKKQLQSKIDDTEAEAHKSGIDSGELR